MAGLRTSGGPVSWLTAAALLLALLCLGVLAGGVVTSRIMASSSMGWDQIADTLGGVMVGLAVALVTCLFAVRTLDARGRLALMGVAIVGCIGLTAYLRATPPNRRSEPAVVIPPPPVEPFSLTIGVANGLAGPTPEGPRLPWELLRIYSNLSFDYVPIDRPTQQCLGIDVLNTPEGILRLTELRTLLADLPRDLACGEPCPACDEVSLQWLLDQERSTLSLNDRCWRTHPQLQPVRVSVERILTTYGGQVVCD